MRTEQEMGHLYKLLSRLLRSESPIARPSQDWAAIARETLRWASGEDSPHVSRILVDLERLYPDQEK